MVKVEVKWGKETYQVDTDVDEGIEAFQGQLFSLTNVPAERQKILAKGKKIASTEDLKQLKDGAKLMLMGTADAPLKEPPKQQVFMEDLTEDQKVSVSGGLGGGLNNLGNTCYMNSTLQCFRNIPEMKQYLYEFATAQPGRTQRDQNHELVAAMGRLFRDQDTTSAPTTPFEFTRLFRKSFPQFAEMSPQGAYMQQDADECLQQLFSAMHEKVKSHPPGDEKAESLVSYLFEGQMTETTKCIETDEPPVTTITPFRRLKCMINIETSHMGAGIKLGLDETLEFRSPTLGRNAQHTRTSRIHKLPRYLNIQFVRFFWKTDTKMKSKILRKVQYGLKFDVMEFCDDSLKKKLTHARRVLARDQDKLLGLDPLTGKKEDKSNTSSNTGTTTTTTASTVTATTGATESTKPKEEAAPMDTSEDLDDCELDTSGVYMLIGVVTHKGRSADSGHYVGWVKKHVGEDPVPKTESGAPGKKVRPEDEEWIKYDDEVVTSVKAEDVLALSGGGDWHMTYLLFYKRIDDMAARRKARAQQQIK